MLPLIYYLGYTYELFTVSVSFVCPRQLPLLPTCVHSVAFCTHTHAISITSIKYSMYSMCHTHTGSKDSEERRMLGISVTWMKCLSDPITPERLSSRCPASECNSISAGSARPTTDCKCRSEMESESSRRREMGWFFWAGDACPIHLYKDGAVLLLLSVLYITNIT